MFQTFKICFVIFCLNQVVKSDKFHEYELKLTKLTEKYDQLKRHFDEQQVTLEELKNNVKNDTPSTCESDWISYSDTKCFKVLEKKGTELEAKANCIQLDSSSTLITIESKGEQDFISNQLKKYKSISDNVWIGLEFVNKSFKWMDGKELKYENWGENAVKDGISECVQMYITESELGKWTYELCQKKYLIVCQKKQSTKTVLSQKLENITKVIEKQHISIEKQQVQINGYKTENIDLRNEIEKQNQTFSKQMEKQQGQINSLIPFGFLYTQLPNQSSPQQLWPNMNWSEVTAEYAGLFFRAEGGASDKFGAIQPANQSWISNINSYGFTYSSWGGDSPEYHGYYSMKNDSWNQISKGKGALGYLEIFLTNGETRPLNTAIKIWKRI